MIRKNAPNYVFDSWRCLCFPIVCLAVCFARQSAAQSCVFQTAPGHPYKIVFPFHSQNAPSTGTTLTVVVLGDSVTWGDGDKPQHKIVEHVGQALANETGRLVEVHSYAHSGARLQTYDSGVKAGFPVHGATPLGDLDAEGPTTAEQADCAATVDSGAEFVLLDGCINEVGATKIALPPGLLNRTTPAEIRNLVFGACSDHMRDLLKQTAIAFPRARIFVMNYYRVVSKASTPKPLRTKEQNNHEENELERAVKKQRKLNQKVERSTNSLPMTKDEINHSVQAWRDNSTEFLSDVTSCFQWAVDSANAKGIDTIQQITDMAKPVCPAYTPLPGAQPSDSRISLVIFPDNDDYAYGAPKTLLWVLPIPLFLGLAIHPDELFWKRNWECDFHPFRGDAACKINPLAHPNPKGASCFSQSILAVIDNKPAPLVCSDATQ